MGLREREPVAAGLSFLSHLLGAPDKLNDSPTSADARNRCALMCERE